MLSGSVTFIVILAVILASVIFGIMFATRGSGSSLDKRRYQSAWLAIENSCDAHNMATFEMAIVSADKLLDRALKESGVAGETMGERLKNSRAKFSDVNKVWTAHKLRNHIAHETDARLNAIVARRALAIYKRSLRELGAI